MTGSTAAGAPAGSSRAHIARPGLGFYVILISAIALFTTEIWTVTLGFLWAVSGILSLGLTSTAVIAALLLPAAAVATWKFARMAIDGERNLLTQPPADG